MSLQAIITLIITVLAAALLVSDRIRPDLIALLVLVSLAVTGIVSTPEAFSGFAGSAVITLVGISFISEALKQTGVTASFGRLLYRLSGSSETRLILVVTLFAAILSMFMNNIAAVGIILPAALTLSRRGRISPSRIMLPLAYGVGLGGMATLLTTANLIFSNALRDAGYQPFNLLSFLPVGGPLLIIGVLYIVIASRKLLPDRRLPAAQLPQQVHAMLFKLYNLDTSLSTFQITESSPLVGSNLEATQFEARTGEVVLRLIRSGRRILAPSPAEILQPGDQITVGGLGRMNADAWSLQPVAAQITSDDLTDAATVLVELLVSPHGNLPGQTLAEADLQHRFSVKTIGVWREGSPALINPNEFKFKEGDALLVQAPTSQLRRLQNTRDLILLEDDPDAAPITHKKRTATAIALLTLIVALLELTSIPVAAVAGGTLMILTGCVQIDSIYPSVEWKAIFLIAGMWPLSIAIRSTGLADLAISSMLSAVGSSSPLLILFLLLLAGTALTQITGGQVTALIMAPIAITTANRLGIEPYGFALACALACSLSFPTPYGHPINIMVLTPGGYQFKDYLRFGLPLTAICLVLILFTVVAFYF